MASEPELDVAGSTALGKLLVMRGGVAVEMWQMAHARPAGMRNGRGRSNPRGVMKMSRVIKRGNALRSEFTLILGCKCMLQRPGG